MPSNEPRTGCEGFYGPCGNKKADWRRINTAYDDDEQNWRYLCDFCYADAIEYYEDAWDEYVHQARIR